MFFVVLSGCTDRQCLYPVGGRELLPIATSYIRQEPGLFGSLALGGYTTKSNNGTQPMGAKIDGSIGFAKGHLVVEGYSSGSLGNVHIIHPNTSQTQYDTLLYDMYDRSYGSIMLGARGMATFCVKQKVAFGVGPDVFYYYENGDYETFRRLNGVSDSITIKGYERVGNNDGFGIGIHIDEKYQFNENVALGMQQAFVYTNLEKLKMDFLSFQSYFQIADNIYVDILDRNRLYVQFGLGNAYFAGIGYRFLIY